MSPRPDARRRALVFPRVHPIAGASTSGTVAGAPVQDGGAAGVASSARGIGSGPRALTASALCGRLEPGRRSQLRELARDVANDWLDVPTSAEIGAEP